MTAQRASAHWMWKWALPKGFNSKGSFNSECYPQTATLTNSCEQRCWKPQNIPASLEGQDATQICLLGSTSEQFNNLTRHFVSAAHKINFRNKRSPGRAGTAPASSLFWKLCCFPKWLQTPPTPKHTHPSILEGRGRYVGGVMPVSALSIPPWGAIVHSYSQRPTWPSANLWSKPWLSHTQHSEALHIPLAYTTAVTQLYCSLIHWIEHHAGNGPTRTGEWEAKRNVWK